MKLLKNYIVVLGLLLCTITINAQISETGSDGGDWAGIINEPFGGCTSGNELEGTCITINWGGSAFNDLQQREINLRRAAQRALEDWYNAQKPKITEAIGSKYGKNFTSFDEAKEYHFFEVAKIATNNRWSGYQLGNSILVNKPLTISTYTPLRNDLIKIKLDDGNVTFDNFSIDNYRKFYQDVNKIDVEVVRQHVIQYRNIREEYSKELQNLVNSRYNSKGIFDKIEYMGATLEYQRHRTPLTLNMLFTGNDFDNTLESYRKNKYPTYSYSKNALSALNHYLYVLKERDSKPYYDKINDYLDGLPVIDYRNKLVLFFLLNNLSIPSTTGERYYFLKNMITWVEENNYNIPRVISNLSTDQVIKDLFPLYQQKRKLYELQMMNAELPEIVYNYYVNYVSFTDLIAEISTSGEDLGELIEALSTEDEAPGFNDPIGPGRYGASVNTRTIGFILRNPTAGLLIGLVKSGSTNISTNAVRFSTRIGLNENSAHEGSEVNAFRHILWQARITNRFSESIAKQIGGAHENNPFVINGSNLNFVFNSSAEADQTIDLLNNIIGRQLGFGNPNGDMQDLSLDVLNQFHQSGFWTSREVSDGTYRITKTKITDAQYNDALTILNGLNQNGYTAQEQIERDNAAN